MPVCAQYLAIEDYVNLVRRAVPVIREEYPEAKIQVGGTTGLSNPDSQAYLFAILESDIMPLVDIVSWHPFYGSSPETSAGYYYGYPSIVQSIRDTASNHGFTGEYEADEMTWRPHWDPDPDHPAAYSETVCAKYHARGILMHLGMDVIAGNLRIPHSYAATTFSVRNLSTLMAGAEPVSLPLTIQTAATNVMSYSFSLPSDDHLIALWTDGVAVDSDAGITATLTLPGFADHSVTGIDVLHGCRQQMISNDQDGGLIIRNLLVKDYPIVIRLSSPEHVFLPAVLRAHRR